MSDSLQPHESQHTRPPCPPATPEVYSNSCPLRWPIQPSHPLLSPSPPAPNPSQHQGLFQWVNSTLFHSKKVWHPCSKLFHKPPLISVVKRNQAQNWPLQLTCPYSSFPACPGLKNFLGHRNFRTKTKESQTSQSFQFSFDLIPKSPALKVVEGLFQDPS